MADRYQGEDDRMGPPTGELELASARPKPLPAPVMMQQAWSRNAHARAPRVGAIKEASRDGTSPAAQRAGAPCRLSRPDDETAVVVNAGPRRHLVAGIALLTRLPRSASGGLEACPNEAKATRKNHM